jgi:hypothetical protein
MPLTLAQVLARLTRDLYPGVWMQERMVVPARSDVRIPHIMGRVPDLVEIGDPPLLGELDGPSVEDLGVVPWSKWFNMNDLATTGIPIAEIPRPAGHPLVETLEVTSSYITVRNWFEIDQDVGLLVMVRQPRVQINTEDVDAMHGVWIDFFGEPLAIAAGTNVDFTDISTYTDSLTPTAWAWTFGDGGNDNVQNPTYNYPAAAPGQYDVQLVVTLSDGTVVTMLKPNYVTVA